MQPPRFNLLARPVVCLLFSSFLLACGDDSSGSSNTPANVDMATSNPDSGVDMGGKEVDMNKVLDPAGDEDGDGLTNKEELDGWSISVDRVGLGEAQMEMVTSDPLLADTDGDGLTDQQEFQKTDPTKKDTDGDTLSDAEEVNIYLSIPTSVDSDGDSISGNTSNPQLWDGDEINKWGTSPSLSDTDGDNRSDFDEIINNSTNPLVAQVPSVQLEFKGNVDVRLDIQYSDETTKEVSYGNSYAVEESQSQGRASGRATTDSTENTTTISVEVEAGLPPGVTGSYSRSTTTGFSVESSSALTQEAARSAQREYQRAQSNASALGETTSSGSISIGLAISNPSELAYKLTNLAVSVFQWDVDAQEFKTVGTMQPTLSEFTLAPNESRAVPNQVSVDGITPDLIREFMREPKSLVFAVSNFDMENQEGLNFAFLKETTLARTARVVIDYGNGTVEEHYVATNVRRNNDGSLAGIDLGTVFKDYLKIPFTTEEWVPNDANSQIGQKKAGVKVLTKVRDTEATQEGNNIGFWAIFTNVTNIEGTYRDFEDTIIQKGESVHIAYLRDEDGDGVYDREEAFRQMSDNNPDSDGDGLGDFEEVKAGWMAGTGLSAGTGYPKQVYSDPTTDDADQDGLDDVAERAAGTDPHNPDTDGDKLLDGVDAKPLDNANEPPAITLTTALDPDPLVKISGSISDSGDDVDTIKVDWGDGFVQEFKGDGDINTDDFAMFEQSHGYLTPGTYTITVIATDNRDGGQAATSMQTYMVTTTKPFARAHYTFDGNMFDSVGNADGNIILTPTGMGYQGFKNDRFDMRNSAYRFEVNIDKDVETYATINNFGTIPEAAFTIGFWINGNSPGHYLTQGRRVRILRDPRGFCIELGENSESACMDTRALEKEWNFVTFVKDGNRVSIWANGARQTIKTIAATNFGSCNSVVISGEVSGCSSTPNIREDRTFLSNLIMDDLRFFDRALDANGINALYLERGYVP